MKKRLLLAIAFVLFALPTWAQTATIPQTISCTGDATATSFDLYQSTTGGPPYSIVANAATCNFVVQVDTTKETCFQVGTRNANAATQRTWTRICIDPTKMPPVSPSAVKVL